MNWQSIRWWLGQNALEVNSIAVNPEAGKERTRKSTGNLGAKDLCEAKAVRCLANKRTVYPRTTKWIMQTS